MNCPVPGCDNHKVPGAKRCLLCEAYWNEVTSVPVFGKVSKYLEPYIFNYGNTPDDEITSDDESTSDE